MVYVDNTYLQSKNVLEDTVALLQALGFTIHLDKLQLIPAQKMAFLDFVIGLTKMVIKVTENKQRTYLLFVKKS